MTRTRKAFNALRAANERSTEAVKKRWTKLAHDLAYDDTKGIDDDVERLLAFVQRAQGVSRDGAHAELVRRLSFAG